MTTANTRLDEAEIHRLALGCILASWTGPVPPARIERLLADGLGGVVLFENNITGDDAATRALTDRLRAAAGRPIVVAADEEGGDVVRLPWTEGSGPGQAALGHLDDVETTEQVYASLGERLARCGLTADLGPVADVNTNPDNPVVGLRSFGSDSALVARHVEAAVRGLQRAGVAAVVKHFPGHGNTGMDSHHDLPVIDSDLDHLEREELPPFRAGIEAGTRAVMTGHLFVPSVDPDRFATISPALARTLLRERLGFTGTVVSDAMEMGPLAGGLGIVEGTVQALIAGTDAIELGFDEHVEVLAALPGAVHAAVAEDRLDLERLRDAAARTAALAVVVPDGSGAGDHPLATSAAARSLELHGDVATEGKLLVVECHSPNSIPTGDLDWSLAEPLRARGAEVALLRVTDDATAAAAVDELRTSGLFAVVVTRDPQRYPWQREVLRAAAERTRVVTVDTGWPSPAHPPAAIRTRGIGRGLLAAAAELLVG